ncbi:MAG TPA: hypothetical protein GX534_07270 [Thermoanaerobacterales bacterium]|nr:hypothetical protein [Thermoanaerobacterales bacterium]
MEEEVLSRLIDLDVKAQSLSSKREKELLELEKQYKLELKQMSEDYIERAEVEAKKAADRIINMGLQEVKDINSQGEALLNKMEKQFKNCRESIVQEVIQRLFHLTRD